MFIVIIVIIVPSLFNRSIQKKQDSFSKKQSHLTVAIKDFLSGFEVIRSYKMNDHIASAFKKTNTRFSPLSTHSTRFWRLSSALSTTLGVTVQCSVMFVAAYLIITGDITAGALVGFVQVSGSIVNPIQVLSQNIPKIGGVKPIIERLNAFTNYQESTFSGTLVPTFQTCITVKNLQFSYVEDQQMIKGIDFTLKRGEKYALAQLRAA